MNADGAAFSNHATPHVEVAVIGGGQAGLSMSYLLKAQGVSHVVLEKNRIAHEWRQHRWDSFCLVTPNWQCLLPGFPYAGPEPQGFMVKDDIVRYLEAYAASFDPPIREDAAVSGLRRNAAGRFEIASSIGSYTADHVVVAIGGYHRPAVPRLAERLPKEMLQLHSSEYRNPAALPKGAVLVIGTGQSGCQIAEDLHREGRQVHLSIGSAPRSPRKYRGRDVVDWLTENGYYAIPAHEHPQRERLHEKTNHYLSGRDGGKEIDLRQFALEGMKLYGRLKDLDGDRFQFHADLCRNLDQADASCESIKTSIDKYIAEKGIDAPLEKPFQPVWKPAAEPAELDFAAAGITSIIWCIGFESDFRWIELPAFNGRGYPVHHRGVTAVPGLYFLGLPWLNTWGSGRFSSVGDDARHLLAQMALSKTSTPMAESRAA